MNERQQAHIDYFLERFEYWRGRKSDYWAARMLAARDADFKHPLRSEEEGMEVFDYLRGLEDEGRDLPAPSPQPAAGAEPHL